MPLSCHRNRMKIYPSYPQYISSVFLFHILYQRCSVNRDQGRNKKGEDQSCLFKLHFDSDSENTNHSTLAPMRIAVWGAKITISDDSWWYSQSCLSRKGKRMTNLKNDDCVLEWKKEIHLGPSVGLVYLVFFSAVDSDFSEMHREILRLKINICKFMINGTKQTNKKPKTY